MAKIGYDRVSTKDYIDTLKEFGCGCVYSERISGVKRTELVKCLDH